MKQPIMIHKVDTKLDMCNPISLTKYLHGYMIKINNISFGKLFKRGRMAMRQNVGSVDQVIRVIIGLVLLSFLFVLDGGVRWFGLIGIVPILTAFVKFCPLYVIFGINTKT